MGDDMIRYDITMNGSLIGEAMGIANAENAAQLVSLRTFPGRKICVMDESGFDVIAEFHNGEKIVA